MTLLFASMLAGLVPTVAVIFGYVNSARKIEQVHVLVNSRLDEALGKIERFELALGLAPGEELPVKDQHAQ